MLIEIIICVESKLDGSTSKNGGGETVYERSEREVLSRWPNNLIRKVKKLKKRNEVGLLEDIRTSLLLSGIAERMPSDLINPEKIDHYENPILSRHMLTHANTYRSSSSPNTVPPHSYRQHFREKGQEASSSNEPLLQMNTIPATER